MGYFLVSFFFFLVIMGIMSLGFVFQKKCLRGSCGGADAVGPDGESLRCDTCPNREKETRGE